MSKGVVIVGAGHAGFNAAVALRAENYTGPVTLLGDEADYPYHRPPLSKTYIKGETEDARLWLRPRGFLEKKDILFRPSCRVEAILPEKAAVPLADGDVLEYEHLILATGSRARPLPVPGHDLAGIETIRTLDHARAVRDLLPSVTDVVVVGGGFIGLEFAAAVNAMGKNVTVLEAAPRLLGRSVAPQVSDYVLAKHRRDGIEIELGAAVAAFEGDDEGRVSAVRSADGRFYPARLVIVGVGALPNDELARAAGLTCDNGIVVDEYQRTSNPAILAIGDVAAHRNPYAHQHRLRLESVQNANDQGRVAARTITGQLEAYHNVPWFWSDQGDIKLQMAGLCLDSNRHVVRGNPDEGRFSLYHFRDGALVAVDSINMASDHLLARKLLEGSIALTPEQAADTALDLKGLLKP
ncbi:MAG: FAD-dependent oxidoreductase [Thiothrix sp.]|nr:FAD-dependent oxidoreductase [Thiothrix sp.]HPE59774.1 FAD-dependent oxidoreductase [Thiolinea sp.]